MSVYLHFTAHPGALCVAVIPPFAVTEEEETTGTCHSLVMVPQRTFVEEGFTPVLVQVSAFTMNQYCHKRAHAVPRLRFTSEAVTLATGRLVNEANAEFFFPRLERLLVLPLLRLT